MQGKGAEEQKLREKVTRGNYFLFETAYILMLYVFLYVRIHYVITLLLKWLMKYPFLK